MEIEIIASGRNNLVQKIYHKKKIGDVVGITIKPELPKQPDIVINNNFKKSSDFLANNLVRKILKIV